MRHWLAGENYSALTSHLVEIPPDSDQQNVVFLTLVREPRARLKSAYTFGKLRNPTDPAFSSFESFCRSRSGSIVSNFQTRMLSRQDGPAETSNWGWQRDLKAVPFHDGRVMIGTVERMEESLCLFEINLRKVGIQVDLSFPGKMNVTGSSEIWDSKYDEMVADDDVLHEKTDDQLTERISLTPGFQDELTRFRQRCAERRSSEAALPPPRQWHYLTSE